MYKKKRGRNRDIFGNASDNIINVFSVLCQIARAMNFIAKQQKNTPETIIALQLNVSLSYSNFWFCFFCYAITKLKDRSHLGIQKKNKKISETMEKKNRAHIMSKLRNIYLKLGIMSTTF